MSFETAAEPWIRPPLGRLGAVQPERPSRLRDALGERAAVPPPGEPAAARSGHSGGNRVFDLGPGADHPTTEADFGFADLLDVINPLQHVPVVSSLYRRITGDEIGTPARIMGGALFGGPLGFVLAASNALVAEVGGGDLGSQALAQLFGPPDDGGGEAATAVAEAPLPERARGGQNGAAAKPLIGEAALDALYLDMTGRSRSGDLAAGLAVRAPETVAAKVIDGPKGRAFPIRPQDRQMTNYRSVPAPSQAWAGATTAAVPAPASTAPLNATPAAGSFFTAQMTAGLEKYEALSKTKAGQGGAALDLGL